MNLITLWLLSALLSWTPAQGKSQERTDKLNSIATNIVDVTYHEPTTFRGPYAHAHMALLVGAVGARESRFEDRIQEGHCKRGECDGGHAYCYMQIHPYSGIELLEDDREFMHSSRGFAGRDLLGADGVKECIHVGAHMIRRALRFSGNQNLRAYIGETGNENPESDERFRLVREYLAKNPPPMTDTDFLKSEDTTTQRE
jgi:hypothetical protein